MKNYVFKVGIALAVSSGLILAASPAMADTNIHIAGTTPDSDGAYWVITEYGIEYSGDWNENFMTVGYPTEVYAGNDYFYCGPGSDNGLGGTTTNETNGDITYDCLPSVNESATGLTVRLHFRLYAESSTGYLSRQWIELVNTSNAAIDLSTGSSIYVSGVNNTNTWSDGDPALTSQGAAVSADGDAWLASGGTLGTEIATTAAWASPCDSSGMVSSVSGPVYYDYPAAYNVIPANSTVNVITFMNMAFPMSATPAGATAAFGLVSQQGEEYNVGSARLTAGLPADIVALGWVPCSTPSAELPSTGVDASSSALAASLAASVLVLGAIAFVIRRRLRS